MQSLYRRAALAVPRRCHTMNAEMPSGSPDLDEVRRVVLRGLAGRTAKVYLFGSWARGEASRVSDIDVAVLPVDPLPIGLLAEIDGSSRKQRQPVSGRSDRPVDDVGVFSKPGAGRGSAVDRLSERLRVARQALATLLSALKEPKTQDEQGCLHSALRVHPRGGLESGSTLSQGQRKY